MATAPKNETQLRFLRNLTRWVSRQYKLYMPNRRGYRVLFWVVFLTIALNLGVQLAYPYDRGLLFASIGGETVRFNSHDEMARTITEKFNTSSLKVVVGSDKVVEFPLRSAGAEPNTEEMINVLSDYPLWQRLIPSSILWQVRDVSSLSVYYTNQPFRDFIVSKSKELSFPAENARLAIRNGEIIATESIAGSEVKADELLQTISRTSIAAGGVTRVKAPAKRIDAARSSKDLSAIKDKAEMVLAHTIAVDVNSETFVPDKNEFASWILLSDDKVGNVSLSVDREKVMKYIDGLNEKVGTPAGQTDISIVNGREVGRVTGSRGRSIDKEKLAGELAQALLAQPKEIKISATLTDVQPSVIFNSKYTATQEGLRSYVTDTAHTKNMHISIQQLDGAKWSATSRADESIPSASTYKLFVSLVLFDKIDKGEIHWTDAMLDTTVAGCFERMTVASTNPCAEKWIAMFGRQYINDFIHARGFSVGTSFTTGSANQTTALDLTKFMIGLNDGTLVTGPYRDRLLDSLGRHPYPYGIPSGSKGIVHNKVGFLWDYVHDAAIVQHPHGTYIMTIMTKGQSYAAIASVTREIERIMYP